MEKSKIAFIPVDNGNMTLIKLNDKNRTSILIDMNIRTAADDDTKEEYYPAANYLREHLETDSGRPILDVLIVTHLDNDHISGLRNHFHLGEPSEWKEPSGDDLKKIIIGELWSSTRYQRNHSTGNPLSEDAKAFKKEMKRRAELSRDKKEYGVGNRVRILGEDHVKDASKGLEHIVSRCDTNIQTFNNVNLKDKCSVLVLGPLAQFEDEKDDDFLERNRGSAIIRFSIKEGARTNDILLTADADVKVWNKTWEEYASGKLKYDIMSAPHHCSWHSISFDKDNKKDVDDNAMNALSQRHEGAYIISQSRLFKEDTPPHKEARKKYEEIVGKGKFLCTAEEPNKSDVRPIEFELYGEDGVSLLSATTASMESMGDVVKEPLGHGKNK